MLHRVICAAATLFLTGCASFQLNYNTIDLASSIDSIYTRQTLSNFSKFIDDPFAIPSQVIIGGGVFQTSNSVTPTLAIPLSPTVATAISSAATGLTNGSTRTLAGLGAGVSGTNSSANNWTVVPLSDSNVLRNQQALYRHAIFGFSLEKGEYTVQKIFFKNKFYLDPYQLQKPHCVLCAVTQGSFSINETNPKVSTNPDLKQVKWLFWSGDTGLPSAELPPIEDLYDLGRFGNHELFMRRTDYINGVLNKFVLFTLSTTAPSEVFQDTPDNGKGASPRPTSGTVAPATNFRFTPQERLSPLFIPQQIQPQ